MGYTSDNFPNGSVLSRDFREFVRGMASDLTTLMRYKPILDAMYMDITGGGGSASGAPFPAMIMDADTGADGVYVIQELKQANKLDLKPGGVQALATNLWETPQDESFIVPGAGCLDQIFPANSNLQITIQRIQSPTCVPVFTVPEVISNPGTNAGYQYFFFCPTPLCVSCGPESTAPDADQIQRDSRSGRQRSRMMQKIKTKLFSPFTGDRRYTRGSGGSDTSSGQGGGSSY